jgi:hypothetical protein
MQFKLEVVPTIFMVILRSTMDVMRGWFMCPHLHVVLILTFESRVLQKDTQSYGCSYRYVYDVPSFEVVIELLMSSKTAGMRAAPRGFSF